MSSDNNSTRWLSPKQVAQVHGVHPGTVYRWLAAGLLPARRVARSRYKIRESDVMAVVEELKQRA